MESIYWVLTRNCNQRCGHCYNDSGPGEPGLSLDEAVRCVEHLPEPGDVPVGRVIFSGGEVLLELQLLCEMLAAVGARCGSGTALWVQTNGDLLDGPLLDRLLEHGATRIDVSSQDRFHLRASRERRTALEALFRSRGMKPASASGAAPVYDFWGATKDQWIGPLWPRGRARANGLSRAGPEHRFCALWSGARGFLDYRAPGSEVNIQLADVYPCCPMTLRPIGSLLEEPLLAILDRCAADPVFRALNEGRPEAMGESLGISEATGIRRTRELGNHCLWCDEFFRAHATRPAPEPARSGAALPVLG